MSLLFHAIRNSNSSFKISIIIPLIISLYSCNSGSQSSELKNHANQISLDLSASDIDSMKVDNQACLDNGENMFKCSKMYFYLMDSCLNVSYLQLSQQLNQKSNDSLKKDQLLWLEAQENAFRQIDEQITEQGRDYEMMKYQEKANFTQKRILELIRQSEKTIER